MSDRNYSITIEVVDKTEDKNPISGNKSKSDTETGKGILSKKGAKAWGKGLVAYHYAKSFTDQIASHEISMVELKTGSRELQERANFAYNIGQKTISATETIVTGALVGGLPGALMGLVTSLLHNALSYQQRVNTINTNKSIENVSIQMNYIRAGANGSRRQ